MNSDDFFYRKNNSTYRYYDDSKENNGRFLADENEAYSNYNSYKSSEGMGTVSYSSLNRENRSPEPSKAEDEMNSMLNYYRMSHGMDPVTYDTSENRRTVDKMDRMVRDHKRSEELKNYQADNVRYAMSHTRHELSPYFYKEGKGVLISLPDRIAQGIKDPETFRTVYKSARTATVNDAVGKCFAFILIGLIFILPSIYSISKDISKANVTEQMIAVYPSVEGKIESVDEETVKFIKGIAVVYDTRLSVQYIYEFEGKEYEDYQRLAVSSAHKIGIFGEDAAGRAVTVYVDPKDHSESIISSTEYPGFVEWLFILIGVASIYLAVKFYLECKNGRRMVYYSGKVKKFKKF